MGKIYFCYAEAQFCSIMILGDLMSNIKQLKKGICLLGLGICLSMIPTESSLACEEVVQEDQEQEAIEYLQSLQKQLEELVTSQPAVEIKEEVKVLTCAVLSFFYGDTEYSWNDLTFEGKLLCIQIGNTLVTQLETYHPELLDMCTELKQFLNDQTDHLLETVKEKIGVDSYQTIQQTIENITGYLQEQGSTVNQKVKSWYQQNK